MNIPELIKEYLRNNDVLTVPRLGTFTLQYKPAKISDFSKTITPPSREIIFNNDSLDDDGLFTDFVASKNEVTKDEAKEQITYYVNRVLDILQKGKFVQLSDIGMISQSGDKLEFSTLLRENFHKPSFGLTDIVFESNEKAETLNTAFVEEIKSKKEEKAVPIPPAPLKEKEKISKPAKIKVVKEQKVKKKVEPSVRSNKTVYWLVAGALTSIVAVLAFVFIFSDIPQNLGMPSFKTLIAKFSSSPKPAEVVIAQPVIMDTVEQSKPIADTTKVQNVATEEKSKKDTTAVKVAKVIDLQNCKEKALNPANDTKKKVASVSGTRFYLIAGSFKNLLNAQKLQADLKKQSYPAELVSDGRTFRISYKSFDTKEKAEKEMQAMQQKGIAGIWILSFDVK